MRASKKSLSERGEAVVLRWFEHIERMEREGSEIDLSSGCGKVDQGGDGWIE